MPLYPVVFEVFATLPKGHTTLRNPKNPENSKKLGAKCKKRLRKTSIAL